MEKSGIVTASAVYALLFAALVTFGRSDVSYVVGAVVYVAVAVAEILYLKARSLKGARKTFCITLFVLSGATVPFLIGAAVFD